jgi:dihydroflavonol-4-reductase
MVVVTGASGLLGNAIVDKFLQEGIAVTALYNETKPNDSRATWLPCDVNDAPELVNIFQGASCVVHAAALVSFAKRRKDDLFTVNVTGTANVVNACLRTGVTRLVHISSVAALGKVGNQKKVTEQTPWTDNMDKSYYGVTKHLAELEVFRGEAEGLSTAMVNPSIILSAAAHNRSSGKIFEYVKNERPFYVTGQLNYVDARDVATMVFLLSKNQNLKGRFIANASTTTWQTLFIEIAKRMGVKPPSLEVSPGLAKVVAGLESLRSALTGSEPLVTRETARMAYQTIEYANTRARQELGVEFKRLEDTLNWCCDHGPD